MHLSRNENVQMFLPHSVDASKSCICRPQPTLSSPSIRRSMWRNARFSPGKPASRYIQRGWGQAQHLAGHFWWTGGKQSRCQSHGWHFITCNDSHFFIYYGENIWTKIPQSLQSHKNWHWFKSTYHWLAIISMDVISGVYCIVNIESGVTFFHWDIVPNLFPHPVAGVLTCIWNMCTFFSSYFTLTFCRFREAEKMTGNSITISPGDKNPLQTIYNSKNVCVVDRKPIFSAAPKSKQGLLCKTLNDWKRFFFHSHLAYINTAESAYSGHLGTRP